MTYDFNEFKVPVFPNINDKPVEPTAIKAGNGSDLIHRLNSFIDKLESSLNSLSSTSANPNWKVNLPYNTNNIKRLDIYYLNISEAKLYSSDSTFHLDYNNLLKSFVSPTHILSISDLVLDAGVGYYVFVAINNDDQILTELQIESNITAVPKGGARLIDKPIGFLIGDSQGIETSISIQPLTIVQPTSTVQINLVLPSAPTT